ncbi:MAG: hypothetical protein KC613_10585 [Myxococcales bacterium]|nr:hypothetical protein [Myxococcales bacterium]MCB9523924.1 hypothetical protein [Myxococcales bacterium]
MSPSATLAWRWLLGCLTFLIGVLFIDEALVKHKDAGTIASAIGMALLAGGWLYAKHRAVAVLVAGVAGMALLFRPWLLPITGTDPLTKIPYELGPFAERNLYALIPGLILCVAAGAVAWRGRRR